MSARDRAASFVADAAKAPAHDVMDEPLRVLVVTGYAIVGGMESTVATLAEAASRQALAVVALCPFESPFTAGLWECGVGRVDAPSKRNCGVACRLHDGV